MPIKKGFMTVVFLLVAVLCCGQDAEIDLVSPVSNSGSLGLGFGLPYGGLGFNADVYVFDPVALTVGIGSFGYTAGYEVGAKYFHGSPEKTWRPQAVLLYGINGIIIVESDPEPDIREAFMGFSIGIGSQFMFGKKKKHGFDFDVLYVLSSGMFKRIEELEELGYEFEDVNRFKFSLGYRYAFDLKF
ncbi:MAG: hypothetical protein R6T89_04950 [Candidatus Syntrophosphaera sp.]